MDAKEAALAVSQMRNVERGLEAAQRIVRMPPPTAAELVSCQSRLEPADDPYAQFSPDAAAAGHLAESVASQRYALSPTGSIHARMEGLEQARRVQNSLTPTA